MRGAWHVDHRVASADGGRDELSNLFAACIECNSRKSDKSVAKFADGERLPCLALLADDKTRCSNKRAVCASKYCGRHYGYVHPTFAAKTKKKSSKK